MTIAPDAAERLRETIAPLVSGAGLFLEDLEVARRGGGTRVAVVVDLPEDARGSVDLDAVSALTREISDHLDTQDAVLGSEPYELEVSTPGAERTLTEPRHFRRSRTRLLDLRTVDGRDLTARLLDVSPDDVLTLRLQARPGSKPTGRRARDSDTFELPLADVASATVLLEFSRPDDTDNENENEDV